MRHLGEARRTMLFDQREKCREAGYERLCSASILLAGELAGRQLDSRPNADATSCSADAVEPLVQLFLEVGDVDVEAEDLRGKGMLCREVLGAPDALLPGSHGHRAIMGLRLGACNRGVGGFILESDRLR